MPADLTVSTGTLFSFLLALARVSGAVAFVPLPGVKAVPEPVRAALAIGLTLALLGRWPTVGGSDFTAAWLAGLVMGEAAVGLVIGISVAIVLEAFSLGAQVFSIQAGYGYASTINPETDADSGILLILAQTTAGLLFLVLGLDRQVIRLLARSFETAPAGQWMLGVGSGEALIRFASGLFSVGMRLAFPIVALLVMLDVSLALLGRLNQQLQLLSLSFPAKMLVALVALGWVAAVFPRILVEFSRQAFGFAGQVLGL